LFTLSETEYSTSSKDKMLKEVIYLEIIIEHFDKNCSSKCEKRFVYIPTSIVISTIKIAVHLMKLLLIFNRDNSGLERLLIFKTNFETKYKF